MFDVECISFPMQRLKNKKESESFSKKHPDVNEKMTVQFTN